MKKYPQYIRDIADGICASIVDQTFFTKTENADTHVEKHVIDDEKDILNRILSKNGNADRKTREEDEKKDINSGFQSLDEAYANIEECVISRACEIAEWSVGANNHQKESFCINLPKDQGYDTVGYCYAVNRENNTIDEYETQSVRIVLEKDDNYPLGFTLLTAYPNGLNKGDMIPTGRDLRDVVKKTDAYKKASPVSKTYMLYQTGQNKPYLATFKAGYDGNVHDDVMSIHIPYEKDGESYKDIIRVKEDSIQFSTSKLVDVKVARNRGRDGKEREKIIYPGEDEERYHNRWTKITTEKRYVKQNTDLVRRFHKEGDKGLVIDLTNPEAFEAFKREYKEAAVVVRDCMRVLDKYQQNETIKEEQLDESLAPHEKVNESQMSIA